MPTVILLDVSLSMTRPVQLPEGNETTKKQLAIHGINTFLDHLSIHSKLEFISLVSFCLNIAIATMRFFFPFLKIIIRHAKFIETKLRVASI